MARNIILLLSTLALFGALFVGYLVIVQDPVLNPEVGDAIEEFPIDSDAGGEALRLPGMEVPSGGGVSFTLYHRETGQPTQRFKCEEWTPVAGGNDEVFVMRPHLTMWLPTGMIVAISADQGQLKVENLEKVQGRPRAGWLRGNVELVLDRARERQRTPLSERPYDEVRATFDELEFDFDLGELHVNGPLEIVSNDFELAGSGLHLVWNQAENVIQNLTLERGDRLVVYYGDGLMPGEDDGGKPAAATTTAPAAPQPPQEQRPRKAEKAYVCVLPNGVVAEGFSGDNTGGGLIADEVRLLFGLGGAGQNLTGGTAQPVQQPEVPPATQSAPASAPAERRGVLVHWGGPLRVEPAPADPGDQPRRHLEALGEEVRLWEGDDELVCSRLEYYAETSQIWLHPGSDGRVEFRSGDQLAGSAEAIYMDQKQKVIKLIGNVQFANRRAAAGGQGQDIRCALWAELHLADMKPVAAEPVESPLAGWTSSGKLKAATFVGEARVNLGQQTLSAERIDVTFSQAGDGNSIESALEKTVASGDVRLEQRDEAVQSDRLEIIFSMAENGGVYPRQMDALGSVRINRGGAWLRGQRVRALMEPGDATAGAGSEFVLRNLDVIGDAAMLDPTRKNRLAARGRQITAEFTGTNELQRGTVFGTPEQHAVVHGFPYTVRGEQVDLEWDGLHVAGPSWLRFEATRSLQGRQRSRATPIEVTSTEVLDVDLSRNTVHLAGNVLAVNGDESLRADEMTLLLEDAGPAKSAGAQVPGWLTSLAPAGSRSSIQACYLVGPQIWTQAQAIAAAVQHPGQALAAAPRRRSDWFDRRSDFNRALRKEPQRLLATNALVQVESLESGEATPVTHSSIGAPRLEIDIVGRRIETLGETTLLVTNRRLRPETPGQAEETFGLPSAMVTRGPSQTAMRCANGMTYALGADGPVRSDSAVFEGSVVFVHRAGRDMVQLEEMLPEVQNHPELLADLKTRNTSLSCDRLECGFLVEGAEAGRATGPMTSRDTRLKWLLASGSAELRDEREVLIRQQSKSTAKTQPGPAADVRREPVVRTIRARQLDFDLEQKVMRVLGSADVKARIYEEHPESAKAHIPWVGEEFTVDLQNRTIRTGASHGAVSK